jgi:hypothetical protein
MQMTTDARIAADELTARCEARFALMGLQALDGDEHAAAVDALLLQAEHAGLCPRIVIWRLRKRLATLLCPPHVRAPACKAAHV